MGKQHLSLRVKTYSPMQETHLLLRANLTLPLFTFFRQCKEKAAHPSLLAVATKTNAQPMVGFMLLRFLRAASVGKLSKHTHTPARWYRQP